MTKLKPVDIKETINLDSIVDEIVNELKGEIVKSKTLETKIPQKPFIQIPQISSSDDLKSRVERLEKKLTSVPSVDYVNSMLGDLEKKISPTQTPKFSNLDDLRNRMQNMESKLNEFENYFKTFAIEAERHITEKTEEITADMEQQAIDLRRQIDDLRTAMIRLSNELKRHKR